MSVKVSIVVPVYNGDKYIRNCIENLLAQTYENLEFVLVDDGSTDNTARFCDEAAKKDSRFVVIHQKNGGLSAARNAGTEKATGDYVVYYDVDDDINKNLVKDNVELAIANDADVVMYSFWYYNVDSGRRIDNPYSFDFTGNAKDFFYTALNKTIKNEIFNAPWNKMYKLDFIRKNNLKFLPEFPIYEDIIYAANMLQYAEKIVVNSKRYYIYYVRSAGSLITKYVDGYFDSVTKFYDNALKYCNKYENNENQIREFSNLYVRLVATNLKQISCKRDIKRKTKLEIISAICDSSQLQSAVDISRLEPKKKFVKHFIKTKNAGAICTMYQFIGSTG